MADDLSTALELHRQGRLQEAAGLYQGILARNPGHADALHLLGVLAHQVGQDARAVELIGRAVALNPAAAVYHCNLGEAYRGLGQFDRAAECCRAALRLKPDYPEAANNLGVALLAQDQIEAAAAQFRAALRIEPDFALACNNLGEALRALGDADGALAQFRHAVQVEPSLAEAHSNLGQLLLERGEPAEALGHCREAVRLRPQSAEAHCNLGNVLAERGQYEQARACYAEAWRLRPESGLIADNLGQALRAEGRLDEALDWYRRAVQLEPGSGRVHCDLGAALAEGERYDEAAAHYETVLRLDPGFADAVVGLGRVRQEQGRFEESRACFREALRLNPGQAPAHVALGALLEEQRQSEEAEACYRAALRLDGRHAGAHAALAGLLRGRLPEADLEALKRLLAADLPERDRLLVHAALAEVLDARGEYATAAAERARANALTLAGWRRRGKEYQPAEHARLVERLIAICTPAWFERTRGFGLDTERPVFILGLPRSGTTLAEQVLSRHSQVFAAGELQLGRVDFETLPGTPQGDERSLECLEGLDLGTARRVAGRHLRDLDALNAAAPRVVDKMPDNYLYLGLLAVLFPRAKFVHCRRDLRDVAVSCWMTDFKHVPWASDFDHLASRVRAYRRLSDHWRRVLPVPVFDLAYEEMVGDLEGVARRLVAWCGLEWEPACLTFHQSTRRVRTASAAQVRQPLYRHAVGRWKHYESSLAPLFERIYENCEADSPPPEAVNGP
jgi:tetratricopeptide (TPR) repeat protein